MASRSAGRRRPLAGLDPLTPDREDIAERAARLGITPERVLQEYARIAFADLRRVADWGPDHFAPKAAAALADADAAAISEVVPAGVRSGPRIKLYDKRAALDAIARHLGMFEPAPQRPDGGSPETEEDPREVIARRLAGLAAGAAAE